MVYITNCWADKTNRFLSLKCHGSRLTTMFHIVVLESLKHLKVDDFNFQMKLLLSSNNL